MSMPLHKILRVYGTAVAAGVGGGHLLGLLFVHFGPHGFLAAGLLAGLILLAVSYALERRARRASNGEEIK